MAYVKKKVAPEKVEMRIEINSQDYSSRVVRKKKVKEEVRGKSSTQFPYPRIHRVQKITLLLPLRPPPESPA